MPANWIARDPWFGVDKIDHFVYAFAFYGILGAFTSSLWLQLGCFAAGAIGIEVLELVRFKAWVRKGRPHPWPVLCDAFSFRDLAWGAAGAIAAYWSVAKAAARALVTIAILLGASRVAAAQQAPVVVPGFPVHMGSATLDSTAYAQELQLYLPPFHGIAIFAPGGDTIVVINVVAFGPSLAPTNGPLCRPTPPRPTVLVARLLVGRPGSVWWAQDFAQRGQGAIYKDRVQALPSGDTLRLGEVWRRRSDCSTHDGTLVILFDLRPAGRRKVDSPFVRRS